MLRNSLIVALLGLLAEAAEALSLGAPQGKVQASPIACGKRPRRQGCRHSIRQRYWRPIFRPCCSIARCGV